MANTERYDREREDTIQFWQTVHQHLGAMLTELGDRDDGWQVSTREAQALRWLIDLHVYTHEIDERLKYFRLPQCRNVPDGYVGTPAGGWFSGGML